MLPKTGKNLPSRQNGEATETGYAIAISLALRRELGGSHQAVKRLMRWTGASERTVKNWLAGMRGPSGPHLIAIIAKSDEALRTILLQAGRHPALLANQILTARTQLIIALSQIDEIFGETPL